MAVKYTEDLSNLTCEMESDKMTAKVNVVKAPGGYGFFKLQLSKGNLPEELTGVYTSLMSARKAFMSYEAGMKETPAAKGERLAELREQRKQDARQEAEGS